MPRFVPILMLGTAFVASCSSSHGSDIGKLPLLTVVCVSKPELGGLRCYDPFLTTSFTLHYPNSENYICRSSDDEKRLMNWADAP